MRLSGAGNISACRATLCERSIPYTLANQYRGALHTEDLVLSIKHGWTTIHIELTDVSFYSWLELESRDGEGKWSRRRGPFFVITEDQRKEGEAEFEALQGLRYSTPKRCLVGKASLEASLDGLHDTLYLGVPEDKSSCTDSCTTNLRTFQCEIHQLDEDKERRFGNIKYEDYETFEGVVSSLYLPPSAFEEVEQIVCSSDGVLSLGCEIKCWHFVFHHGNQYYYVDKKSPSPVEVSRISLKKIVPASAIAPDWLVDERGLEEDSPDEPLLLQKLEKIEQNIDSLKLPLWVAAIAAMAAAISLIF